jgi:hypothetical protein
LPFGDYIVDSSFSPLLGQYAEFDDVDSVSSVITKNSQGIRECVLVKNDSATTIAAGTALNFTSGGFGQKVQICPAGSRPRLFAPAYIRGSSSNTIADQGYFWAIKRGPTSALSDGTAIATLDPLCVGAASGKLRTEYALGGGLIYSNVAASTALTASSTATKFDKSYTFPADSLFAGDVIRVLAQVIATSTNSTDTLTIELMIGSTVVAATPALDATNNDLSVIFGEIVIRTAGASGTLVGAGTVGIGPATTATMKQFALASTAIDTTASQQVAIRGTWSTNSGSNSCRLDVLNISRLAPARWPSAPASSPRPTTPSSRSAWPSGRSFP